MQQRPLLALSIRACCALAGASLLATVKLAGESGVSLPEIIFWRQAIPVPIFLAWLAASGGLHRLRTQRLGSHLRRTLVGTTNMVFNFGAAILLPLAVSTTLGFTTPIFAVILTALWFRDHVGPWRWTAVALGFSGILLIAQPGGEHVAPLGALSALIAAFLIAVINFQIRDLGRTEAPIATSFWFSMLGAPMAALALPFVATAHTPHQWLLLVALGVLGALFQLLLTGSLRYGSVASVIVVDYTSLIWATAYGWLFWDRLPPLATWLGAPLVVGAGLLIAWREHRLSRQTTPFTA